MHDHRRYLRSSWIVVCLSALIAQPARLEADVFRFKDGRVIAGNAKALPEETINKRKVKVWAVEVEPGVFLRVLENELANNGYEPISEERQQYERNVAQSEQTVEAHWAVAGECAKHGLTDLARAHFLRILDLAPDYRPARVATGYKEDNNGRWVKKEVEMGENRGKVFVKGRWRFPEMLEVEEAREESKRLTGLAARDLNRWHNVVLTGNGARVNDALQNLSQINDPLTIPTLIDFLLDQRKPPPNALRMIYAKLLAQFQTPAAAGALARASIIDPDENVRNVCQDSLRSFGSEIAIPIYIGYLGNSNNALINRAAQLLGDLRAETAFWPLVDALVTKHIQPNKSAGINASPTSGSFSMGGGGPVEVEVPNRAVADTLSRLTGQSFGFDRSAWIAWYASLNAPPARDVRRDP